MLPSLQVTFMQRGRDIDQGAHSRSLPLRGRRTGAASVHDLSRSAITHFCRCDNCFSPWGKQNCNSARARIARDGQCLRSRGRWANEYAFIHSLMH